MLRVENLKAGDLPALSFEIAQGECLAVEGPSGAGKTRLLRAIADLDPAPGHVFIDGVGREETAGHAWRRLVRYVAAEPAWWTDTARPAMAAHGGPAPRLERLLAAVALEPRVLDQPLAQLSTGERQRLALVRALRDEPKVLLLDEPTAALDVASAALVEELLRFQLLSGRAAVLVSHDQGLLERLAHARLLLGPPRAPAPAASARMAHP